MKFFHIGQDGGPESNVTGFWLVEIKSLFSIALLRFSNGSREAFHSHAFNSISWVLRGGLIETHLQEGSVAYDPSWRPIITRRCTFHRVFSVGTTWVLTFRGPWCKLWKEYDPHNQEFSVLSDGRTVKSIYKVRLG